MADSKLNLFLSSGTNAERLAFTPDPPTPAAGAAYSYLWVEEDTGAVFVWDADGAAWIELATTGAVPAHQANHNSGGSDPLKLDDLADPDDNTDLDADTSEHGLMPKWTSAFLTSLFNVFSSTQGAVLYRGASDWLALATGTSGKRLTTKGAGANPVWEAETKVITFTVGSEGGDPITTGYKGHIRIPQGCTIVRWSVGNNADGDIEWNVYSDAPGSAFPPTTSIVASDPPKTTGGATDFASDNTLSGWTPGITAQNYVGVGITSVDGTLVMSTLSLEVTVP